VSFREAAITQAGQVDTQKSMLLPEFNIT